jgi:hypothetical protein
LIRTLSGPFDDLFFTQLSAPWALCGSIIAVISASTVCYGYSLSHASKIVKSFLIFSFEALKKTKNPKATLSDFCNVCPIRMQNRMRLIQMHLGG